MLHVVELRFATSMPWDISEAQPAVRWPVAIDCALNSRQTLVDALLERNSTEGHTSDWAAAG